MKAAVVARLLVTFGATTAQAQSEGRVIRGTVIGAENQPVPYVNVQTTGQGRTITNDSGSFSYRASPKGEIQLRVFRIGYEPQMVKMDPAGDTTVRIELVPIPRTLEAVQIESNRISERLKGHGFYERMEARQKGIGSGTFFTREDIEQRQPIRITQMLETVSGLRVIRGMQLGAKSSNDQTPGAGRMGPSSMEDFLIVGPGNCHYSVYIDGTLVSPRRDVRTRETVGFPIDPYVGPNATAAIEIYPRGPGVPPQYSMQSQTCGVVVFWSR